MKRICAVTTVEVTLINFVIPAMRLFKEKGWDVTLVCNMTDVFMEKYGNEFHCVNIPMGRGVSFKDLLLMPFKFKKFFKENNFDVVQYATPNASLYASIGAKWAGVNKRVYCQWGIRYVGCSGVLRKILKAFERFTCSNSTHIRPASWKNLDYAVSEGLYNREKASTIGDGGTVGIDLQQFDIKQKDNFKKEILSQYPQLIDKTVYAFVGRLNRDKGVFELLQAFMKLKNEKGDVALMLIGKMEGVIPEESKDVFNSEDVIKTGWTNEVPKYLSAADVLVHPSYREGFSMVIQQAMALELPVVTTDIPGPSEVITEGETGILAQARDVDTLFECMKWMAEHKDDRIKMGKTGRIRCEEKFNRERMLQLTLEDRNNILNS